MDRSEIAVLEISASAIFGGGGRAHPAKGGSVFIAYRMNDHTSRAFRAGIEERLKSIGAVSVLDGRVREGDAWAQVIRGRINSSRLIIADVTGPSREVLFEVGFARNKPLIP